jgi:hypothetical protein
VASESFRPLAILLVTIVNHLFMRSELVFIILFVRYGTARGRRNKLHGSVSFHGIRQSAFRSCVSAPPSASVVIDPPSECIFGGSDLCDGLVCRDGDGLVLTEGGPS